MSSIPVEICVDARSCDYVEHAVTSAHQGGAVRIELCGDMSVAGITPDISMVEAARNAMGNHMELLCMLRPRGGGFIYTDMEIQLMKVKLTALAEAGATGVVFGVLTDDDLLNQSAMSDLVNCAHDHDHGLLVTCHRAIDSTRDRRQSLEMLRTLGVDRVLSSGTLWGTNKGISFGIDTLKSMAKTLVGGCELVLGGGISSTNVGDVLRSINEPMATLSIHAYSSVLNNDGAVCSERVRTLCLALETVNDIYY